MIEQKHISQNSAISFLISTSLILGVDSDLGSRLRQPIAEFSQVQYSSEMAGYDYSMSFFRWKDAYSYSDRDAQEFKSMIQSTIGYSRRTKTTAIIIDKAAYELQVYVRGELVRSFPLELSLSPFTQKEYENDRKVPEGMYRVIQRKDSTNASTKFYRALLLDYPNKEDWQRFFRLKKESRIPDGAANPGSLIEIHGHGSGKNPLNGGVNWTFGCPALSNEDMDRLWNYVHVGTPVTIVRFGTKPLTFYDSLHKTWPAYPIPNYALFP